MGAGGIDPHGVVNAREFAHREGGHSSLVGCGITESLSCGLLDLVIIRRVVEEELPLHIA